jgi:hypothetical protein
VVTQARNDFSVALTYGFVPWTLDRGWLRVLQEDLGGFGDVRLRRVGARLLEAMGEKPATCVHALTKDRNDALSFGRFLGVVQIRVTPETGNPLT